MLKELLVAVAMMGVLGSVRAELATQIQNPVTPARAHSDSAVAPGESTGYSFADIVNLPARSARGLPPGDTVGRAPDALWAQLPNVTDAPPARAQVTAALTDAVYVINGAVDDLSAAVVQKDYLASRPGNAALHTGAGFLFSTAEIPRPAGWITLLCSLVVMAFMARRKRSAFAS